MGIMSRDECPHVRRHRQLGRPADETDGGWSVELSLVGSPVLCLAVDPADRDTVYAGLGDGGVRRTSDGGRTWVESGLPEQQVFSIAVSRADGAVYAGTE